MSNWPGAGAAITLVYEARQGANKERMISRRRVGHLHIVTMLGLSWPHLPLEIYILSTSSGCARCAGLRSTDSRIARPRRGREDKNGAQQHNEEMGERGTDVGFWAHQGQSCEMDLSKLIYGFL